MSTPLNHPETGTPLEEAHLKTLTTKELQPILRKCTGATGAIGAYIGQEDCMEVLLGRKKLEDFEVVQSAATGWKTVVQPRNTSSAPPPPAPTAVYTPPTPEVYSEVANTINQIVKNLANFSPQVSENLDKAAQTLFRDNTLMAVRTAELETKLNAALLAAENVTTIAKAAPVHVDLGNGFVEVMGIQMPVFLKPGDPGYEWVPQLDLKFDPKAWNAVTELSNGTSFDSDITTLIKLLLAGVPTHLWGVASVGKTDALRYLCAIAGWPLIIMPGRKNFDEAMFFGAMGANPQQGTHWQDGLLPIAMQIGAVFLASEVDCFTANATNALNPMLDTLVANVTRGPTEKVPPKLVIAEANKVVQAHPNFRFMADSNTNLQGDDSGLYVGTQVQNAAFISRVLASMRVHYMSPASEIKLLMSKAGISKADAKLIVEVAKETRKKAESEGIRYPLTHRHTLAWATLSHVLGDLEAAFVMSVMNKMSPSDGTVVLEIAQRVMGDRLTTLFKSSPKTATVEATA